MLQRVGVKVVGGGGGEKQPRIEASGGDHEILLHRAKLSQATPGFVTVGSTNTQQSSRRGNSRRRKQVAGVWKLGLGGSHLGVQKISLDCVSSSPT